MTLKNLWDNTTAFHVRFENYPPNPLTQLDYADEELTEFAHEIHVGNPASIIAEEMVDTMVCLMSAAMGKGVEYSDIVNAIRRVIDKNNRKNLTSHQLIDGQIIRKDKVKL